MASLVNEDPFSTRPIDMLLVEDDASDIKLTLRVFERAKLHNPIQVVHDGEEALAYLHRRPPFQNVSHFPYPDLVLLDLRMPKIDGFQVLKTMKADPAINGIPIIILTSSRDDEDLVMSFMHGAWGFLHKPVEYCAFVKLVNGLGFHWQLVNKLPQQV